MNCEIPVEYIIDEEVRAGLITGILSHLLTIGGFLLALIVIARLMRDKRQPSNTLSWLMLIVLIPYVGVPLYLLVGGRKLRRLAAHKHRLYPPQKHDNPIRFAGWMDSHPLFEAAAHPPTAGNVVEYLTTGEETFRALEREILAAKESINIMMFILGRDKTGRRVVELLAQRAREGVKVRLLLDALGCIKTRGYFVEPIRRARGEIARFMPMLPFNFRWSAHLRNHRKIAIFDHKTAMVGGHNIAMEYMGPTPWEQRFQDFGALISGPAVFELEQIFFADWNFATRKRGAPASPPEKTPFTRSDREGVVQVIASGPDVPNDPLYEAILLLAQEARESITIITPYFVPDEVLFRSLLIKLHSAKEITIIVPHRSNHPITDLARAYYLRELKAAGARVLTYMPGMLHAKVILVDGRVAMFGSANMDLRSLFVHYEVGLFCYSSKDVEKIDLWARSIASKSAIFENDSERPPNFARGLAEDLSRLLAPFM